MTKEQSFFQEALTLDPGNIDAMLVWRWSMRQWALRIRPTTGQGDLRMPKSP
jgi:hypothetical protein